MSKIIVPRQQGIVTPKHIIKERIDQAHRQEWDDPDRYQREKKKALVYINARAPDIKLTAWERLVHEVARVFHDDLASDPDIREAAQRCCFNAQMKQQRDLEFADPAPEPATTADVAAERGDVRGVDDSDETLASLEWQLKEEETD